MKTETFLSDLQAALVPRRDRPTIRTYRMGWGTLRWNTGVGGQRLRLGNAFYEHGWGDHAQSHHLLRLPSPAVRFEALVGIQGDAVFASRVIFSVYAPGGGLLARSPELGVADGAYRLVVDIPELDAVEIGVIDTAYDDDFDGLPIQANANWCDPVFTLADGRRLTSDDFVPESGDPVDFRYDGRPRPYGRMSVETLADTPELLRLRVTERHPDGRLTLVTTVTKYRDFPVVEWLPELVNEGDAPSGVISDFHSLALSLDVPDVSTGYIDTPYPDTCHYPLNDVLLRRTLGSKNMQSDFTPETVALRPRFPENSLRLDTDEGRSSAAWLPFFGLDFPAGRGINVGIGWSGRWFAEFRHDGLVLNVEAGMPVTNFRLMPGERLRQVSIFVHDRGALSVEDGQNQLRRFLLAHHSPHGPDGKPLRPPLPQAFWGGQSTDDLVRAINRMKAGRLPFDTVWVDAGWFGKDRPVSSSEYDASDWATTVGNWRVNRTAHPDGLRPVADAAHAAGFRFLLWVEMERAMPDTPIAREHPDWLLRSRLERFGLLLNLGNEEARAWAVEQVTRLVREEGIDDYRQDFNFNTIPYWYGNDAPDRVGVTEMKHVDGLYRFWDELRARFPGMLIDNCASGGRRIDFESNSRSICLYRSDMLGRPWFDCSEANLMQVAALSAWVPLHAGGTTVLYGDDYAFFSGVAAGVEGSVFDERLAINADWFRDVLTTARRMMACFLGDIYLVGGAPESRRGLYGYQCHLPEEERGFFAVFRRPEGDEREMVPRLRAIDPAARYEVETFRGATETLSGTELLARCVTLDAPRTMRLVFYRRLR